MSSCKREQAGDHSSPAPKKERQLPPRSEDAGSQQAEFDESPWGARFVRVALVYLLPINNRHLAKQAILVYG